VTVGALIKPDALKRASIIDAELGWPRGLAAGRLAMLWSNAQTMKKSVAKRRLILEWACVDAAEGVRFLDLCCKVASDDDDDHIHFLERQSEDRYFIVGNPEQLEKIQSFKTRASAGGKGKAEKAKQRREAAKADSASSSASSNASSVPEEVLQLCPLPFPSPEPKPPLLERGAEDHTARARVDPPAPTHARTEDLGGGLTVAGLSLLWRETMQAPPDLVTAKAGAFTVVQDAIKLHPEPDFWRKAISEFHASDFTMRRKPGGDETLFWCPNPFVWMVEHADDLVAGKYRNRPPKNRGPRYTDVPDAAAFGRYGPTGFKQDDAAEPPDPGDVSDESIESIDPQIHGDLS
jgi:hypothetical protein